MFEQLENFCIFFPKKNTMNDYQNCCLFILCQSTNEFIHIIAAALIKVTQRQENSLPTQVELLTG